jgi:hypothetical protein
MKAEYSKGFNLWRHGKESDIQALIPRTWISVFCLFGIYTWALTLAPWTVYKKRKQQFPYQLLSHFHYFDSTIEIFKL